MLRPELTVDLTAEELIRLRFAALEQHDFSLLYASYHPFAPFLEQFPHAAAYLEFAVEALFDITLYETYVGASRAAPEGIELLCGLCFELKGEKQTLYELALVKPTEAGWRYHSAQKLTADEYLGEFDALDFIHFDRQPTKIRF